MTSHLCLLLYRYHFSSKAVSLLFFINSDNKKFIIILMSIRVLIQILFTYIYIIKNVVKYSMTAKACFQYLFTNTQMFLHLFKDLL